MEPCPKNPKREERIHNEAIVDAYGEAEVAMSWYYYLEGKMQFPFKARCIAEKRKSRLKEGDKVKVTGMAGEDECQNDFSLGSCLGLTFIVVAHAKRKSIELFFLLK